MPGDSAKEFQGFFYIAYTGSRKGCRGFRSISGVTTWMRRGYGNLKSIEPKLRFIIIRISMSAQQC